MECGGVISGDSAISCLSLRLRSLFSSHTSYMYLFYFIKLYPETFSKIYFIAAHLKYAKIYFQWNVFQVLLMEQYDQYYKLDNWPPESDRMQLMRLVSDAPLQQHILVRVLMMGLSKEHSFTAPEALELADQLVRRAASTTSASDNSINLLKGNFHYLIVVIRKLFI